MNAEEHVSQLIQKAREAQKIFEGFSQERVDAAVQAIGKAVYDDAERLARMAVDETKMGKYEDKVLKNKGKPKVTWQKLIVNISRIAYEIKDAPKLTDEEIWSLT